MATKANSTTSQANSTKAPKPTYKAVTGTKAAPATPYRALRQAKGYGRVALANALGVTPSVVWALENHTPHTTPAGVAALRALAALPNVGKANGGVPAGPNATALAAALGKGK